MEKTSATHHLDQYTTFKTTGTKNERKGIWEGF